ncbi:BLOC-1-related complex subunit 8 [Balamuthia mandrillaris]
MQAAPPSVGPPAALPLPLPHKAARVLDTDTNERVFNVTNSFSDYLIAVANEPATGLYHVEEHVRVSVPKLVRLNRKLGGDKQRMEDTTLDLDYSIETVESLHGLTTFQDIQQVMRSCMSMMEEITKRNNSREASRAVTLNSAKSLPAPSLHVTANAGPNQPSTIQESFLSSSSSNISPSVPERQESRDRDSQETEAEPEIVFKSF